MDKEKIIENFKNELLEFYTCDTLEGIPSYFEGRVEMMKEMLVDLEICTIEEIEEIEEKIIEELNEEFKIMEEDFLDMEKMFVEFEKKCDEGFD